MEGYDLSAPQKPAWLEALLSEKFFVPCTKHAALKKNERNVFCVDCNGGVCQHCVSRHHSHCLLQIRRYVYHDVIRLQDMQRLVDCSQVQTYIINSSRVVFLNQRPQPRPSKGLGNTCATCDRSLQDSYSYCSVACKADAAIRQGRRVSLTSLLPAAAAAAGKSKNLSYASTTFNCLHPARTCLKSAKLEMQEEETEEELIRVVESEDSPGSDELPTQTSSNRTGSDGVGYGTITSTASTLTMMPKKLRSGRLSVLATSPKSVLVVPINSVKRRKGTPHRSPVC